MRTLSKGRMVKSELHTLGQIITRRRDQFPSYTHWRCAVKNVEGKMTPLFQKKFEHLGDSTPKDNQGKTDDTDTTCVCTMRTPASKALQKMKEWSGVLGPPPENL